jgi:hypothetical protein
MSVDDWVSDLSSVRSKTKATVESAFEAENPILVESPPNSGKTRSALESAASLDNPVTYLCGRIDLYEETQDFLDKQDQNLSVVQIPSPHRHCKSFQRGEPGNEKRLKKLYSKGYSGRELHYSSKEDALTPCGDDCEYMEMYRRLENEIDTIDILVGHHSHSHRDLYINNRVVILDEFNAGAFITNYPNPNSEIIDDPEEIVPAFLESLAANESSFPSGKIRDFTDLLVQRHEDYVVDAAIQWFLRNGASRRDAAGMEFFSPSSFQHDRDHLLAPFLTLSLLCMERVGPQIEMAPHPNPDTEVGPTLEIGYLDIWKEANLNPSTRVVRNRNTSEITILRPPDLSNAKQVIGLDGTPTLPLWNLLLPPGSEFELQRVIPQSEFTEYLESALNFSLVQIGDGMHHYAGGRISEYDRQRFRALKGIEGEKLPLISSNKAIDEYREKGLLHRFVAEEDPNKEESRNYKTMNFASTRSSNKFKKEDLGMVFGTPYPGDDIIRRWAGLCAVGIEIEGTGKNKKFIDIQSDTQSTEADGFQADGAEESTEGIGEKIYQHYTHNQVVQAILRFGRDEELIDTGGATVYISTHALPSWFDVTKELTVSTDEMEAATIGKLYEAFVSDNEDMLSYQTAPTMAEHIEPISNRHVRDVLNDLVENDIATCRRDYGYNCADQYKWNPETTINSLQQVSVVCATDKVYIFEE